MLDVVVGILILIGIFLFPLLLSVNPIIVCWRVIRYKWFLYTVFFGVILLATVLLLDYTLGLPFSLRRTVGGLLMPVWFAWALLTMIFSDRSAAEKAG